MSLVDKLKNWLAPKEIPAEKHPVDTGPEIEPDSEVQVRQGKRIRITGDDVTYIVPQHMSKMRVRLLHKNGAFKEEYVLTKYLRIQPGDRFQIIIE